MPLFKKNLDLSSSIDYMFVGLGNPGAKYDNTRHNVGFVALDLIAQKFGVKLNKLKFKALYNTVTVEGKKILLLKPQTFMNLSGESVRDAIEFFKIPVENVVVVFDDVSLDVGCLKIKTKGSDGGHNGIKNIIYLLGSDAFPRIKIGVGKKPHKDFLLADWVLSSFKKNELPDLNSAISNACEAIELIIKKDLNFAMNNCNRGESSKI